MRNNRTAGHNYERLIVRELQKLGFDVVTARAESRNMDNKGVDIFSPFDCSPEKNFPFYIQCKNYKDNPKYDVLLTDSNLPEGKPTLVFHRKSKKAKSKFVTQGDFVIIKKEDFYNLITKK